MDRFIRSRIESCCTIPLSETRALVDDTLQSGISNTEHDNLLKILDSVEDLELMAKGLPPKQRDYYCHADGDSAAKEPQLHGSDLQQPQLQSNGQQQQQPQERHTGTQGSGALHAAQNGSAATPLTERNKKRKRAEEDGQQQQQQQHEQQLKQQEQQQQGEHPDPGTTEGSKKQAGPELGVDERVKGKSVVEKKDKSKRKDREGYASEGDVQKSHKKRRKSQIDAAEESGRQ